jgi:prepilin-type processing-associated H-X9-DG protein
MRLHSKKSPPRAYTLIEILVVIGIIMVLLAILIPSFSSVRRSARSVTCLNQLKQLRLQLRYFMDTSPANRAGVFYSNSQVAYVPPVGDPPPTTSCLTHLNVPMNFWLDCLRPSPVDPNVYTKPSLYTADYDKFRMCPDATVSTKSWIPNGTAQIGPGASMAWSINYYNPINPGNPANPLYHGGYAMNGWIYCILPSNNASYRDVHYMPPPRIDPAQTTNYMISPSTGRPDVPAFMDGIWIDAWPMYDAKDPTNSDNSNPTIQYDINKGQDDIGMGRVCIARHNKSINIVFLDGHAENVTLDKLWTFQWSKKFQVQSAKKFR